MFTNSLNSESQCHINNIVTGLKNHPMYAAYNIRSYCYDMRVGVHAIEISKNGQPLNLFLFYPDDLGNGNIGSIAIYGANLKGHLAAIRSSNKIFGLEVESADIDYGGISDYIDVYLK